MQTSLHKVKCTKSLITSINRFTLKEKYHILRILKNHNIDFSKNSYGYFFNLNNINDDIFNKLWKCVDLIECNRDIIKHMDKKREDLINYYTSLIENNLIKTRKEKFDSYIKSLILLDINNEIQFKVQKKNIKKQNDVDPDILIKEYYKKNKYPKNSVYYRIMNVMKSSKSNRFIEKEYDEIQENGDTSSDYEFDGDNDNFEINDNEMNNDDIDDDVNKMNNEILNVENDDEIPENEIYENDNEFLDEEKNEATKINDEETENLEEETTYQHDLNFYKKLLNKQGFVFNENLKCILQFQPYIK